MVSQIQSIDNNIVVERQHQPVSTCRQAFCASDYQNDTFEKQNSEAKKLNTLDYFLLGVAGVSTTIAAVTTHKLSVTKNKLGEILESVGKIVPSSIKESLDSLFNHAIKDGMSELFNKDYCTVNIPREYKKAISSGKTFSVGMLDMDCFKGINDIFGHDIGDDFIKRIATNIHECVQKYEAKGYRNGGDEFVVSLLGKDSDTALKMMQEISEKVKNDHEIQKYFNEFKTKIHELKSKKENEPAFKLLDDNRDGNIFERLRNTQNLSNSEYSTLKEDIESVLTGYIENVKPKNKKTLVELLNQVKLSSTRNPISLNTSIDNAILGKELDNIFNRYKSDLSDINKWIPHVDEHGKFTISGGLVSVSDESIPSLIKAADLALYSAKDTGKNKIHVADEVIKNMFVPSK